MENKIDLVKQEINTVVKGKEKVVDKVLCTMIAGGHILLEDIPGVGKTTLAMTIAKSMSLSYKRVQFTPDVLPSDVVGFSMYNSQKKDFEYKEGAVNCNLFLADEINRTSPKTQSALLEAMEEGNVTVDGVTRSLPSPFTVIATENPIGASGTQMLPDSQLDRFMVCLSIGYPAHEDAINILVDNAKRPLEQVKPVIDAEQLKQYRKQADEMFVHESMYDYIVTLVERTRENEYFSMGASPRGAIALLRMAKAMAVIRGREYIIPEDVLYIFYDVLSHRVKLSTKAKASGMNMQEALKSVYESVNIPRT